MFGQYYGKRWTRSRIARWQLSLIREFNDGPVAPCRSGRRDSRRFATLDLGQAPKRIERRRLTD